MGSSYSVVHIEGYCLFDSRSKRFWKAYGDYDVKKGSFSSICKTVLNPSFLSPSNRPAWCKKCNKHKIPQFRCLAGIKNMCPFFGFTNCSKSEYRKFNKIYEGDQK